MKKGHRESIPIGTAYTLTKFEIKPRQNGQNHQELLNAGQPVYKGGTLVYFQVSAVFECTKINQLCQKI